MTKSQSSHRRSTATRAAGGGIITLLLVAILLIVSQLTGIDLIAILTGQVTPTSPPPVGTPVAEVASPFLVYFSAPTGSTDPATYVNGPDTIVAAAINDARQTVDMAAFELNARPIADALIAVHRRGVTVRLVTDDDHGLDVSLYEEYLAADADEKEDLADEMETPPDETLLDDLYDAGIPIVDDGRGALMHNKFIIIDGLDVWTGSMNLTVNGSYRNNNNFIRVRNRRIAENYQAEFDEMFLNRRFGPRSPRNTPYPQVTVNGVPVEVYFAPEDGVVPPIIAAIEAAQSNIRFLAFSFTLDEVGSAMLARASAGVTVQGVFENVGSETQFSELKRLFCSGLDVRQDGNPFILHHKVIIIDNQTVLLGSFNFSSSAASDNDENLMIIHDPGVAAQYLAEFEARFAEGSAPQGISCN